MSSSSASTHELDSRAPDSPSEHSAEPPLFGLALALVRSLVERSLTAAPTTPELDALHDQPELAFLREIFDLDAGELNVLLTCLAFALDPSLADAFARVSGSTRHRYPTEPLVARLFGWGHRRLLGHGNLLAWSLVRAHASEPAQPPALELDPQLGPERRLLDRTKAAASRYRKITRYLESLDTGVGVDDTVVGRRARGHQLAPPMHQRRRRA